MKNQLPARGELGYKVNGPRCAMLVPPPPGDGAGSLASGAGSSAAAATDAADAAELHY